MTMPSTLGALEYAAETAFAESSTSYTHRLPILGPIDATQLQWEKQDQGLITQYMHGDSPYITMGQGGTIEFDLDLTGHGATTVGSPTIDAMETFMGLCWGNVSAALPASTTFTGAGSATAPTTTASGTFPAGGLCIAGTLGDTHGNAQMHALSTHAATTLNLLTALGGTPANTEVLRAATNFYLHETPFGIGVTSTVPGLRFRWTTPNLAYTAHGCGPVGMTLSGQSPGERPKAKIKMAVARWGAISSTGLFPSATTSNVYQPQPVTAGSLFVNDVGTATRVTYDHRQLQIDLALGGQLLPGPGGVGAYQKYSAYARMPSTAKWSWVVDADAPTASPVLQGWGTDNTKKVHALATLGTVAGYQVGFYSPLIRPSSVPTQMTFNGRNSLKFEGMAKTGPTTTNDLTASMLRMGWG